MVSMVMIAVIVGFLALVVMRVVPTFVEYQSIRKALVRAVSASGNTSPEAIRNAFDRAQVIDDFTAISGKDLKIERRPNEQLHVSFDYEKRVPLFGPVSLVIQYQGDSTAR